MENRKRERLWKMRRDETVRKTGRSDARLGKQDEENEKR